MSARLCEPQKLVLENSPLSDLAAGKEGFGFPGGVWLGGAHVKEELLELCHWTRER